MGKLKVIDIFESVFIWQVTECKPSLEPAKDSHIYFVFPETDQTVQAVHDYLEGVPSQNALDFVTRYKLLRVQLYSLRDSIRGEKQSRTTGEENKAI